LGAILVGVLLWSSIPPAVARSAGSGAGGLKPLGVMPFDWPFDVNTSGNTALNLFIDPSVHRGFLVILDTAGKYQILVYDLQRLRREAVIRWPLSSFNTLVSAVDPSNHRLFIANVTGGASVPPSCDEATTTFIVLDTKRLTAKTGVLPCVAGLPFAVQGLSYHAPSDKLYAIGVPAHEQNDVYGTGGDLFKERTYYVQIDPDSYSVDWAVDATTACDWSGAPSLRSVLTRYGDHLVSYCYQGGYTYNFGGQRGEAIEVPIASIASSPSFHKSPTFTFPVAPVVDPATGRLLLYADGPPYGPAVWGYDAFQERFVGVAPAGEKYDGDDDRFQGFDPITGRLYIVNPKGTALIDARTPVLSGGETFPALSHMQKGSETGSGYSHDILIDGNLRRLFIPYPKRRGFIVVQDDVPPPVPFTQADLDQGTADIPEVEGTTASAFSSAANAFGIHMVNVGGIPGAIDNWDQACYGSSPVRSHDPQGQDRCLADQLITAGNREYYLGQTGLELASESGISAFGSVLHVSSNDSATGTDFRSMAACFSDRIPDQVPLSNEQRSNVATTCRDQTPLGQFQYGSTDPSGKDVPFPGSLCVDETGKYARQGETSSIGDSSAECDKATQLANASADTAVLALPGATAPVLSIAHASSTVGTAKTAEGIVTTVTATASGIRIGDIFTIGRVHTEATTKAHGRSATTVAQFKRAISDVHGPGIDCAAICDTKAVVDAFNQAFASQGRMRALDPFSLASPHGYQGLVVKDPGLRASDSVILNDDSDTFNGLDLIINNEGFNENTSGPNARSSLLVGLAGVHAESRYGIFPIAIGGSGTQPPFSPITNQVPGVITGPPPNPGNLLGNNQPPMPTPAQVVRQVWRLIVNNPGEAALLFALLLALGSPVYLGMRSRSLTRSLRA